MWHVDRTKGGHYLAITGPMRAIQDSRVAALLQGSKPASPQGLPCTSDALGALRGITRAPVAPLLWARARTKDKNGL